MKVEESDRMEILQRQPHNVWTDFEKKYKYLTTYLSRVQPSLAIKFLLSILCLSTVYELQLMKIFNLTFFIYSWTCSKTTGWVLINSISNGLTIKGKVNTKGNKRISFVSSTCAHCAVQQIYNKQVATSLSCMLLMSCSCIATMHVCVFVICI